MSLSAAHTGCLKLVKLLIFVFCWCRQAGRPASMSAGGVQPTNPDPLRETTRYVKVADLSHGSFGFVQLARNTETQELVAIKFIERGDRVNRCVQQQIRAGPGGQHIQPAGIGPSSLLSSRESIKLGVCTYTPAVNTKGKAASACSCWLARGDCSC
jgi:hypothetical protein